MSPLPANMSETEAARATLLRVALAAGSIFALYFSLMALAVWEGEAVYSIFLPLVILIVGMLASSLARLGLRGRYVEPLSRSLLAVGVTASFLALVFEGRDLDPARLVAAVACAIATLACSVLFLVSHPGRSRFVLRASALLLAGLAGFAAATLSNSGPVQALGPVILASALAAALLSLVPLVPGGNSR
ncbi:MAG TPA: hypothetical protein VMS79_00875, partial [Methanomassiliicoccales archaeon]|nr:hypothetical protein [Methanomassiliicoccales archaeon]